MSKAGVKFTDIREQLLKDEEFRAEYERLKPRYAVIAQIIEVRTNQNITQEELALRVGTQKSNRPVVSFRTKRYHSAVRALDTPCESRQHKRFSPACLIAAIRCRCAPHAA